MCNDLEFENNEPQAIFENVSNELEFGAPRTDVNMDYNKAINKPKINGVELKGNLKTEDLKLLYEKLLNLPSINNIPLIGNKTTEELGIKTGSDVKIVSTLDVGKTFEEKYVYNANVTNLVTLALMNEITKVSPFDVYCTISLATMRVSNISDYSAKIIEERNKGRLVRMNCSFAENPSLKVSVLLDVVDGNVVNFYPLIVGDIGAGTKNYLFMLQIRASSGNISATALADDQVLQEFVSAVEEFAGNISTMLYTQQSKINNLENRIQALENKIN